MTREEIKLAEYQAAQEMLRHYDTLNWQIGAVLIAATTVLTGLAFQKDFLALIKQPGPVGLAWLVVIPMFSAMLLLIWYFWYERHRGLYNLRNETLHRIERELGMYHHLRGVEMNIESDVKAKKTKEEAEKREQNLIRLQQAREAAGVNKADNFYKVVVPKMSGNGLALLFVIAVPAAQLIVLLLLKISMSTTECFA